uniref:Endoplasmic reticulum lectin 1 n=1 Tax=Hydra vulgaris TaxID=6087 RepID=T2M7R1_HYDVU
MLQRNIRLLFLLIKVLLVYTREFDDQVQYQISWKEPFKQKLNPDDQNVFIQTNDNEQYQCIVPDAKDEYQDDAYIEGYQSPEALFQNLFFSSTAICSLKLEPYWTYQLCHGYSITQYHEESYTDEGVTKLHRVSEFNLGVFSPEERLEFKKKASLPVLEKEKMVPKQKFNDQEAPYFLIEMSHGDPCDLTGEPRRTSVFYICHQSADNELLSIKEVTTCHYEVIVLTSVLCLNPNYKIKTKTVHEIKCHALGDSPSKPMKLTSEYKQLFPSVAPIVTEQPLHRAKAKPNIDLDINRRFLNGEFCLTGGTGWWQYEFCNGKFVNQFHVEANRRTATIRLGSWNKEEHIKWFKSKKNVSKERKHVVHLYTGGDFCDLIGEPRKAFVYLMCRPGNGQELIISMLEEKSCQYKVTVESPILCQFIENVDKFGLFTSIK